MNYTQTDIDNVKKRNHGPGLRKNNCMGGLHGENGIMKPKKYLHVQHVAERLDCSAKRVYEMIQNGELEAIRIGPRGMRVAVEDLDNFIAGRRVDPEEFFV